MADVNPLAHRLYLADLERFARPGPRARPCRPRLAALLRALAREVAAVARPAAPAGPA